MGNPEIVASLLAAGSDVNAKDWLGDTPLHRAAWTDFLLDGIAHEPRAHRAALGISDFDGWIQYERGTGRITTYESARRHAEERAFIEAELTDAERDGTAAVVITHHAPTPCSIAPRFHGSDLNPAENPVYDPALCVEL